MARKEGFRKAFQGLWEGRGRAAAEVYKSAGLSRAQSLRQQTLWGSGEDSLSRSWGWGWGEGRERRRQSQPSASFHGVESQEVSGSCQIPHWSAFGNVFGALINPYLPSS